MGGGARVEQPGPRAGRGRFRDRGAARDEGALSRGVGRRVGGRGGGGIRFDAAVDGAVEGPRSAPFGWETAGVGSGPERANSGMGLSGVAAEALGVVCSPSSERRPLWSDAGAGCCTTGWENIGLWSGFSPSARLGS